MHCTEVILAAGDRVGGIAKEDDPFSDDVVGEPTITYDKEKGVAKLCIEILDADGDLHGNNNDVQDVGTEGDCIEVYIEVRFKFDAGWSIGVGGASASAESTSGTSDSATTEFCPC